MLPPNLLQRAEGVAGALVVDGSYGTEHLRQIQAEAKEIVNAALA